MPPRTPASVVHVRPPEVKVPPMPAFPPVESVVAVKLPVILLVSTIDNPPEPFEIWPVEFTCVQDRYPTVELPVTLSPLVEVRPAEVIVPAMLAFPEETVSPLLEVRPAEVSVPAMLAFPEETVKPPNVVTPLHTRAFVVSKPMPNLPVYCPEV